jgi:hypothetical protein
MLGLLMAFALLCSAHGEGQSKQDGQQVSFVWV